MGLGDEFLADGAVDPRQRDIEPDLKLVAACVAPKVHLGVNCRALGDADLLFRRDELDRAEEACGPIRGEELLGVGAAPLPDGERGTSSRPSSVRERPPSRPPEVWARAV